YRGKGRFVERDEATHRVVIKASGKDTRSAGTATATVTASLATSPATSPAAKGDETRVDVATDLSVTGRPAQFGRGMIADVTAKLVGQFAGCVATTLTSGSEPVVGSEPVTAPATAPAAAEPVDLVRLTGGTATARRLAGYGAGAVLLALLAWLVIRRLRRSPL